MLQCNNKPSSQTARGHQFPAAFLIRAAGLDKVTKNVSVLQKAVITLIQIIKKVVSYWFFARLFLSTSLAADWTPTSIGRQLRVLQWVLFNLLIKTLEFVFDLII